MIDHPNIWFDNFYKYIISPSKSSYGDLCILSSDAPSDAKESYFKYINLIRKYIPNWWGDYLRFENLCIVGIEKDSISELASKDKEQLDILFELIDSGVIDNDPFIKLNRP